MITALKGLKSTWLWPSRAIDPELLTKEEIEAHNRRADTLMNCLIETAVLVGESQLTGQERDYAAFLLRFAAGHLALIKGNLSRARHDRTYGTRHMARWLNLCIGNVNEVRAKLGCSARVI